MSRVQPQDALYRFGVQSYEQLFACHSEIKGEWYLFKGKAGEVCVCGCVYVGGGGGGGEGNFVKVVLPPFWKGFLSERKEFALCGSIFFPFRVVPFEEKACCAGKQKKKKKKKKKKEKKGHKSCLPWREWWKIYIVCPVPLK